MISFEKILIWISLIGKFGHFFNSVSYLRTIIIFDFVYYIFWETSFWNLCTQLWYHFACSSENGIMSPANLGFVNCFPFILISCPSRSLNFGNFALESFQKRLSIRGCLAWHYFHVYIVPLSSVFIVAFKLSYISFVGSIKIWEVPAFLAFQCW